MEAKQFIDSVCALEGFKVKFRELHWNAKLMSDHKLCDSLISSVTEFQDSFAEEGFPIFGKFNSGEFFPIQQFSDSTKETLFDLQTMIYNFKALLTEPQYCSLSALCDNFLHEINKSIYLNSLK